MSDLIFRPYIGGDKDKCLAIFKSNTPRFFGVEELDDFRYFLEALPGSYFVATLNDEVVACGGYGYHVGKQAVVLTWGMVRSDLHNHGLGKYMLVERLKQVYRDFGESVIKIDTSQHSKGFFEKFGFETTKITENYFSLGIHRVDMELKMNEELYRSLAGETNLINS